MNVASAMKLNGETISDMRIAVNAVAPRPMRLKAVEDAVRGKPANAETGEMAGKLAVQGAVPLQFNAYKIPLMRNLVKRAIGGVQEATWSFIQWATSPWGQSVPIHIAWGLIWVAVIAGLFFMIVHALYVIVVQAAEAVCGARRPKSNAAAIPERVPRHSLAARLFHWIMAASMFTLLIHGVSAQGGRPVQLGALSLDCGPGADGLDSVPHRPLDVFPGFLVDLAGQDRYARRDESDAALLRQRRAAAQQVCEVSARKQAVSRA